MCMAQGWPEAQTPLSLLSEITKDSVLLYEPYPTQGKEVPPLLPHVQVEGVE